MRNFLIIVSILFLVSCTKNITNATYPVEKSKFIFKMSVRFDNRNAITKDGVFISVFHDSIFTIGVTSPGIVLVDSGMIICKFRAGSQAGLQHPARSGIVPSSMISSNQPPYYFSTPTYIYSDTFDIKSDTSWIW